MEWKQNFAQIQSMSRLVTTCVLKDTTIDDNKILDTLKKFDMQFKVLIFENVLIDTTIYRKLVGMFQLDRLIMTRTKVLLMNSFYDESEDMEKKPPTRNGSAHAKVLDKLTLYDTNTKLLNILAYMKLQSKSLIIKIDAESGNAYHHAKVFKPALTSFMDGQHSLKEMIVKLPATRDILGLLVELLKSKELEKLSILVNSGTYHSDKYDGLAEIIKSQPKLRDLEIFSDLISGDAITEIYQIQGLQRLCLEVPLSPNVKSTVENPLRPHANLKSLILSSLYAFTVAEVDKYLKMFANIETLGIDFFSKTVDSPGITLCALDRLKSLKLLMIPEIKLNYPNVSIPSLKTLLVKKVDSMQAFYVFVSQNPQLEEIHIDAISDHTFVNGSQFELPRELKNLKILAIGHFTNGAEAIEINEDDLYELKTRCPNLVEIRIADHENITIVNENFSSIRVVKFKRFGKGCVFKKLKNVAFSDNADEELQCIDWVDREESSDNEGDVNHGAMINLLRAYGLEDFAGDDESDGE